MKYIKTYESVKNIDLTDNEATVLMRHAITGRDIVLVKKLINAGFDTTEPKSNWLSLATSNRTRIKYSIPIIKELISSGIDLNINTGNNPLHTELSNSRPNMEYIRLLLDSGADPNIKIKAGNKLTLMSYWALLFISNSKVFAEVLEELIKYGLDLSQKSTDGKDFLDYLDDESPSDEFRNTILKVIKKHFPKLYSEYQLKKDANKYNI